MGTVLPTLAAGTKLRVHLGPCPSPGGTVIPYQTNGYADGVAGGWQAVAGMNLVGSGVDVTVLQLVNATASAKHYFLIGHALTVSGAPNLVDFATVSDMTLDCNLSGASNTGASAFGAVRLFGNHVRVSRVKAIKWGTKAATTPCFTISVLTGDRGAGLVEVIDPGIEGCIAVSPDADAANVGPATALHAGGKEDAATSEEAHGKGPFIRNCFVDCGSPAAAAEYRGLSIGWCRGGIVEGNQVHNTKYGGPYQDKSSALDVIVRNNFYKNVAKGPYWKLGIQSAPAAVSLSGLTRDPDDTNNKTALATTSTSDHGLQVGERVKIDSASAPAQYKGVFRITNVPALNKFKYQIESDPGSASYTDATYRKVFGVGRIIADRNTIELAIGSAGQIAIHVDDGGLAAADQAPDYVHGDVIVRENKIRCFDAQFDSAFAGSGIEVNGAKHAILSANVVECAPSNSLKNLRCGTATYFHNTTPSGALIQGFNGTTKYSELETDAEDALVLSLV